MSSDLGPHQLPIQSQQTLQMEPLSNSLAPQQLSVPNKEIPHMISMSISPMPQNTLIPDKRATQTFSISNVGLQQLSVPKKRRTQPELMSKKLGTQQLSGPIKRNAPMEPSSKGQAELSESVRAKLRESLADALALVPMPQRKAVESNLQSAAVSNVKPDNENSHLAESISATVDVGSCDEPVGNSPSKVTEGPEKINDSQILSRENSVTVNLEDATQISKDDVQEFQLKYVLLDEDVSMSNSFLVKDDFLQGNGLCWASDLDVEVIEAQEFHSAKKPKLANEVGGDGQGVPSPKALANRIEAELFKLFGGVNKKYKEKGRSLLFNLKDHNNPELRERVMSGDIPPERLCSMTAEDLASKELSQWRIAKAEELAQMVVLPDTGVDVRRLVKKTHKGEFQVEFEQDDGASVEFSAGTSSLSQYQPKTDEKEAQSPNKTHETETSRIAREKANAEGRHTQRGLATLPSDSTDLMHGLVVDDLKDAEFLPPIVSLDEFMESLHSEPPFESLPAGAGQTVPMSDEKRFDAGSELGSSDAGSRDQVDASPNKLDKVDTDLRKEGGNLKSNQKSIGSETPPCGGSPKGERLWEGLLQLNISSTAGVSGYFKSGDKTSAREWPSFLDIKGRVRLDAFGKFLQELHMSRSRAIMVVHFCWKEGSPESGRGNLSEVVNSYVADERVGFAEPAPGVELYLCPPHKTTVEMLGKHLTNDDTETLNAINNGLIGIVIWRKPHVTSTLSPNSSSHHKHSSKKNNHLRRQDKNSNKTPTPKPTSSSLGQSPTRAQPILDDENFDDVPPGFGPASSRDEDDLPEFDFVSSSGMPPSQARAMNSSNPHARTPLVHPVNQMRELVSKYGRSSAVSFGQGKWQQSRGIKLDPWNDDDDIPEWRPQQTLQQQPPPLAQPSSIPNQAVQLVHGLQHPPPHMNHRHFIPISSHQPIPTQVPPHQMVLPQVAQRTVPIQSIQPPMNVNMNMNVNAMHGQKNWQIGASASDWPAHGVPRGPFQGIGTMQPCGNFGPQDQFYGAHGHGGAGSQHGGVEWRPDVSRSRGF